MMKRHFLTPIVAGIVAITGSSVSAYTPYGFEDTITKWTVLNLDAQPLVEGTPFSYTHDLGDDVDFADGDWVAEARLELGFTNDFIDCYGPKCGGDLQWDYREFVRLDLSGSPSMTDLGEVDAGPYQVQTSVDWLNDHHQLTVTIDVYNYLGGTSCLNWNGATATAWLDYSRLHGTAVAPMPVPAALLLGVLGLGTAGMKLRRRT